MKVIDERIERFVEAVSGLIVAAQRYDISIPEVTRNLKDSLRMLIEQIKLDIIKELKK